MEVTMIVIYIALEQNKIELSINSKPHLHISLFS